MQVLECSLPQQEKREKLFLETLIRASKAGSPSMLIGRFLP